MDTFLPLYLFLGDIEYIVIIILLYLEDKEIIKAITGYIP